MEWHPYLGLRRAVVLRPAQVLCWLALGLVFLVALFPEGASASAPVNPVGTWNSTAVCCGGTYAHVTTINHFNPDTGVFSGTDSNGALTGKMTGASFTMKAGVAPAYWFVLKGSISGNSWSGTWTDSNGENGTWTGTRGGAPPPVVAPPAPSATHNSRVSSIGSSLPTVSQAFKPLTSDVTNAAITLGLALFLTFPSNLFNSTFEENYADICAWWEKWAPPSIPFAAAAVSVRRSRPLAPPLHQGAGFPSGRGGHGRRAGRWAVRR